MKASTIALASAFAAPAVSTLSGTWKGSVPLILDCTVTLPGDGTMNFDQNVKVASTRIQCPSEKIAETDSSITFPDAGKDGDCFGDALRGQSKDPSKFNIGINGDGTLTFRSDGWPDLKLKPQSLADVGASAASIPLTTFDGAEATTQRWTAMNDPVMGGKSKATFTVDSNAGVFEGAVAIVPSLQAPGFCTMQSPRGSFPDISGADALEVVAKQTSEYKGWRFTIGDGPRDPDSGAPFFVKGTYKANVAIPVSEEFQTVTIPFTDFTYKWSDTTGEPTVKCVDDATVCPTAKYLKTPKQLTITAEGVEGSFHLEVKSITAVNTATKQRAVLV